MTAITTRGTTTGATTIVTAPTATGVTVTAIQAIHTDTIREFGRSSPSATRSAITAATARMDTAILTAVMATAMAIPHMATAIRRTPTDIRPMAIAVTAM